MSLVNWVPSESETDPCCCEAYPCPETGSVSIELFGTATYDGCSGDPLMELIINATTGGVVDMVFGFIVIVEGAEELDCDGNPYESFVDAELIVSCSDANIALGGPYHVILAATILGTSYTLYDVYCWPDINVANAQGGSVTLTELF